MFVYSDCGYLTYISQVVSFHVLHLVTKEKQRITYYCYISYMYIHLNNHMSCKTQNARTFTRKTPAKTTTKSFIKIHFSLFIGISKGESKRVLSVSE